MITSVNLTAEKRKGDEERKIFQKRRTLEYFSLKFPIKNPCLVFVIKSLMRQKSIMLNDTTRETNLGLGKGKTA